MSERVNGFSLSIDRLFLSCKARPVETSKSLSSIRKEISSRESLARLKAAVNGRKISAQGRLPVKAGYVQNADSWGRVREYGNLFRVRVTQNVKGASREYKSLNPARGNSF